MHGRVKTRTTAEENEKKKKDREKKVAAYAAGMEKVFSKRKNGELDEEGLVISGQLLSANPDIYTLWNFRKEVLSHLKETLDKENLEQIVATELHLTEVCLRYNPKSYGTWHHRCWVLDKMLPISWKKEVAVCNKYLDLDERNFHVWDYRRFVVEKAEVSPEAELEYTTEKINKNFSNYSAWHYRSKLLPIVHPDPSSIRPIEESIHKKELEMVESAAFTDPYDQSAWFYLRWLLGRIRPNLSICQAVLNRSTVSISFNQNVNIDCVEINGLDTSEWRTANSKPFSHIFVSKMNEKLFESDEELIITIKSKQTNTVLDTVLLKKISDQLAIYKKPLHFEAEFSPGLTAVLRQQLDSCTKLLEFEPDSKWALLTSVYLMQAIDRKKYKEKTMILLGKLMDADFHRTTFYSDLRSRYKMEYLLEEVLNNDSTIKFTASDCQLSALYHMEHLMAIQIVDLSNNSLCSRSLPLLSYLQFCKVLKLDKNKIESLKGFPNLPYLESLSLSSNQLNSVEGFDLFINNCVNLRSLDVSDNPITKSDLFKEKLKEFHVLQKLNDLTILS
ncbi:rab geranylgeranyltransferase subunit alpha [Lycorma delicatula]|uniref:rab geranylgeranyltransferase subunit alpha n=1 Tax=Lycorma delicatula TaxID=130591 RepID=UPI003F5112EB